MKLRFTGETHDTGSNIAAAACAPPHRRVRNAGFAMNAESNSRRLKESAPASASRRATTRVAGARARTGSADDERIMLTILLRHDQSNNLDAVQTKLKEADWWERFPPEGVEIVSWVVAMGLGQVVTVRLAPSRLAALNVELERSAWGVFRTECYPAYDFVPVRERIRERVRQGGK
jgi:hypothetical protein